MPCQRLTRHRRRTKPQPQVSRAIIIQRIDTKYNLRRVRKGSTTRPEANSAGIIRLRLIPGTHLLRAERATSHVRFALGISNPRQAGSVHDGVGPRVDVGGETAGVDVRDIRFDAPVLAGVEIGCVEPADNLGVFRERRGKVDALGYLWFVVLPGADILRVEGARLDIFKIGAELEIAEAGGVQGRVRPCVEAGAEALLG